MDYWAKDFYSWGIISAEVCPRSSIDNVWSSDEAYFLLSGHVNSKNSIFWSSTPPEHCLQRQLHSVKCTAWVAISKHGIIGPFWFEDDNEQSVTINRAICPGAWQVLDSTWLTERGRQGPPVVPAGWCHPPFLKRIIGMAQTEWSAAGVTRSGGCIHRTWTLQIFICRETLRTWCMATIPRLSLT